MLNLRSKPIALCSFSGGDLAAKPMVEPCDAQPRPKATPSYEPESGNEGTLPSGAPIPAAPALPLPLEKGEVEKSAVRGVVGSRSSPLEEE